MKNFLLFILLLINLSVIIALTFYYREDYIENTKEEVIGTAEPEDTPIEVEEILPEPTSEKLVPIVKAIPETGFSFLKPLGSNDDKYSPLSVFYGRNIVHFKESGMESGIAITKGNKFASTYGGTLNFEGEDNKNTHFIGYIDQQFKNIEKFNAFFITDRRGKTYRYQKYAHYEVDSNRIGLVDKIDYSERILGLKGGERATFEVMNKETNNRIIIEVKPY